MLSLIQMARTTKRNWRLLFEFSRQDIKRRYVGTLFGPLWAIFHPLTTIAIFWFVFEMGLKIKMSSNVPFFYYFVAGIIPWFLFMETISTSINTICDNRHLITKVVFPSEILPVSNFLVSSIPHFAMMGVVIAMLSFKGLLQFETMLGLLYYYICLLVMVLGLSWGISSVRVFFQDSGQMANVILNMLFWLTPIVWSIDILPAELQQYVLWNPMTYIVTGYRDSLMYGGFPWDDLGAAMRFWIVTLPIAIGGAGLFQRLRHEFADVL